MTTKKVFSVLLAVCMLLGASTVSAFAESDHKTSRIAYFSGNEEIHELVEGSITAKIKVKSDSSSEPLCFAAILYRDSKIIAAGVDETPEPVSDTATTYEAEVQVPSDLTGLKLVTILWNNLKDMKAICTSGLVPSSDARLLSVSVDGDVIDGFSSNTTEYEYTLSAEQMAQRNAPYIEYTAADNGARVEITDAKEFPGESSIRVTAPDGTEKIYRITYKCEVKLAEVVSVTPTAHEANIKFNSNLTSGIAIAPNRAMYLLSHVDESLEGLDYITSAYGATSADVKFNRAATVHAFGRHYEGSKHKAAFSDWTLDTKGWDRSGLNNWPDDDTLPEDEWTYGTRIGDGINEFPDSSKNGVKAAVGTKYDLKTQGWMYLDLRAYSGQEYRTHSECTFNYKYTKMVEAGTTLTIPENSNTQGIPLVMEWAEWEANDYTELDF